MDAENRSAIVTLVERVTRYLILVPVFTGRPTASGVRDGIVAAMAGLPSSLRRRLTWDQGKNSRSTLRSLL